MRRGGPSDGTGRGPSLRAALRRPGLAPGRPRPLVAAVMATLLVAAPVVVAAFEPAGVAFAAAPASSSSAAAVLAAARVQVSIGRPRWAVAAGRHARPARPE